MKQYVIDELRLNDYNKLREYLEAFLNPSGIAGIYWIPLEDEHLTPVQTAHGQCQPYYVAIELTQDRLTLEFLIRSQQQMRCSCIGYADHSQRHRLMDMIDAVFEKLEIIT